MTTFDKVVKLVDNLIEEGRQYYPYIKRSKAKIMATVKTPKTYLNPSKEKVLKPIQYEFLLRRLERMTIQKVYKELGKIKK